MLLGCLYLSQHQENSCITTHYASVIIKGEEGEGVPMYFINSDCDSEVSVRGCISHFEQDAQAEQHMANAAPGAGGLACIQVGSLVDTGRAEGKGNQSS